MSRLQTIGSHEINMMLILTSQLDPEPYSDEAKSIIYKAKSLVEVNDDGTFNVKPFYHALRS